MFQMFVGALFTIIFLCGLAGNHIRDKAWDAYRREEDDALHRSIDTDRVKTLRKLVSKAFEDSVGKAHSAVYESYGGVFNTPSLLSSEVCERVRDFMDVEIFSNPLFENIKEEIDIAFPDGIAKYLPVVYDPLSFDQAEGLFRALILAKDGLIDKSWSLDHKDQIWLAHPNENALTGHNIPYECRLTVVKIMYEMVTNKNPDMRLHIRSESGDNKLLEWIAYNPMVHKRAKLYKPE